MNPTPRKAWPAREKKYDWFRVYNDFVGHPKFRFVAKQLGMHICEVSMIALALFKAANRSKPRGWVRDFALNECGAALDIEPAKVGEVYRMFEQMEWIQGDYLATWDERQPDKEDPTAAERQQRRRDKLKAQRQGKQEVPAQAEEPDEKSAADISRYWLITEGKPIVARRIGTSTMAADLILGRWMKAVGAAGVEELGRVIGDADRQNIDGRAFQNLIGQKVDDIVRTAKRGPPLPLPATLASVKS